MSIAEKLTYLQTTKQLLKTEINKINNVLTDESTFRSYPQELFNGYLDILNNGTDTLWNNLEKVSASGEEATLENVETAPIKMVLNGNTSQETTTGKNLLNPLAESGTINATTGEEQASSNGVRMQNYIDVSSSNTWVFSRKNNSTNMKCRWYGENYNYIGYEPQIYQYLSSILNKPTNAKYLRLTVDNTNINYFTDYECQLEQGSTATSYEPYTGGQPSPSPDYPQEVKVVKGENVVSVQGKNLYTTSNLVEASTGITIIDNNSFSYEGSVNLGGLTTTVNNLKKNTDYVIYFERTSNTGYCQIKTLNNITITEKYISYYANGIPFNSGDNTSVKVIINPRTTSGTFYNIQLEEGTAKTDFVPYSKTDYPINLVSKNKLDLSKIVKGRLDNGVIGYESGTTSLEVTNNKLTFVTNTNYRGVTTDYIEIKNGNYIFFDWLSKNNDNLQVFVAYYDKDKNYISQTSGYSLENAFRFSNNVENSKYIRVYISLTVAGEITLQEPQVEFASNVNEFEEYFNIELCKINTYKDYFHKDSGKWYVHKEIGKVLIDGNENWSEASTSSWRYRARIDGKQTPSEWSFNLYSNYFKAQSGIDIAIAEVPSTTRVGFKTNFETLADFKTWLSTHNTTLYYVLATPTETEITNTTLIEQLEAISKAKSVKDKTYITQTNDELPFILDVEAIKEYEVN